MVAAAPQSPLDERLIQVTLDCLAEDGLEGLTLRRIARRAGVSHGAPLRHFAGLSDLLAEVAACGFALLSESIAKAAAQLPPGAGPLARLAAAGRAYVRAATDNPGLFTLMFRPEDLNTANASFGREAQQAFAQLLGHVRAAQDAGWHADSDTRVLAGSVWSAVHGLALLWAQGAFQGVVPDTSLEATIETVERVIGFQQGERT